MFAPGQAVVDDDRRLTEAIYKELRRRARFFLRKERAGHTLQPTEVAHEAWLRISANEGNLMLDRQHFLALAGTIMRHVLVDYGRKYDAVRRGGKFQRVELKDDCLFVLEDPLQVLQIDEALTRLAAIDARAARVVELRFFAGLTEAEAAEVIDVPERTVKSDWAFAKAWMRSELVSNRDGG